MSVKLLLVLVATGCGRVNFDAVAFDASPGDGPFGQVAPFSENTTLSEDDPSLSGDALELYFDSERDSAPADGNIWMSKRADLDSPWSAPVTVSELSSTSDENSPGITADGLTITFASERPSGPAGYNLWIASRLDRASPWSAPVLVGELSSQFDDDHLTLSADKLDAVFSSNGSGNGTDLYEARRASMTAPFEPPRDMTEINTAGYDGSAVLSADGLTLVFTSDRNAATGFDLYIATRSSRSVPFGAIQPLTELNTTAADQDPTLSADLHIIAFVRGEGVDRDIYFSER